MRVPRIYQSQSLQPFSTITLDEQAARHVVTVLRMKLEDKIILFNGDGLEYPAELTYIRKNMVEVRIKEVIEKNFESFLKLHLGQVITKGEKMDYLLQKATELGVTSISPLFSTRGEVRLKGEREEKKQEHWQRVLQSACEQCGRNVLPQLYSPLKLLDWVAYQEKNNTIATTHFVLDHRAELSLKEAAVSKTINPNNPNIVLLIGPEGGLTFEERALAENHGFTGVHLGPRVLRSETAGVAAITLLQGLVGDLGHLVN